MFNGENISKVMDISIDKLQSETYIRLEDI